MSYLLDANVLAYFWNAKQQTALQAAAEKAALATPETVRDELERSPKFGKQFKRWISTTKIAVLPIVAFSPAHEHLLLLHPDESALRDKGERACIALAAQDPALVFVANDKAALWLALRELYRAGTSVIGLRVFLRQMAEQAGMPGTVIDRVVGAARGESPTWWVSWRKSIGPKEQP